MTHEWQLIAPDWAVDIERLPRYPDDWDAARLIKGRYKGNAGFVDWVADWCLAEHAHYGLDPENSGEGLRTLAGVPAGRWITIQPTDEWPPAGSWIVDNGPPNPQPIRPWKKGDPAAPVRKHYVPAPAWVAQYLHVIALAYRLNRPEHREHYRATIVECLVRIHDRIRRDTLKRNLPHPDSRSEIVETARKLLAAGTRPRDLVSTIAKRRLKNGLATNSSRQIRRILKKAEII